MGSVGAAVTPGASGTKVIHLFTVPADDPTVIKHWVKGRDGTWTATPWAQRSKDLGGFIGQPVAIAIGTTLKVFVLSGGGEVLHYTANEGVAAGVPESLGAGATDFAPGVAVHPTSSQIDVFVRGRDDHLWQKRLPLGGRWSGWGRIALPNGKMTSAPSALWTSSSQLDVFYTAGGNVPWHYARTARAATFEDLGGVLLSTPSAVSSGARRYSVFGIGSDGSVWHRDWSGSWGNWRSIGGYTRYGSSPPAVVSAVANRVDLFLRAGDQTVWQHAWISDRPADEVDGHTDEPAATGEAGCTAGGRGRPGAPSGLVLLLSVMAALAAVRQGRAR